MKSSTQVAWMVLALFLIPLLIGTSVSYRKLEDITRMATRIEIGQITKLSQQEESCSSEVTFSYQVLETLRGTPRSEGSFHLSIPHGGKPGGCNREPCPEVDIVGYPCNLEWNDTTVGKKAIFYHGDYGLGCDPIEKKEEVIKSIKTQPTEKPESK